MTDCAWAKPGDINEDGLEIEQDGWITRHTDGDTYTDEHSGHSESDQEG